MRTLCNTDITKDTLSESRGTFCLAVKYSFLGIEQIGSTAVRLPWLHVEWAKLGLLIPPSCLCYKLVVLELHCAKTATPFPIHSCSFYIIKYHLMTNNVLLVMCIIPIRDLERPLGCQVFEAPIISRQSAHEGGSVVTPRYPPPSPLTRYHWYSSPLQAVPTLRA
jgi:hypothetical protein